MILEKLMLCVLHYYVSLLRSVTTCVAYVHVTTAVIEVILLWYFLFMSSQKERHNIAQSY